MSMPTHQRGLELGDRPLFKRERSRLPDSRVRYWIAENVFVTATVHGGVILDLANDAYLGLDRQQMDALRAIVQDWPVISICGIREPTPSVDAEELATALLKRGVLTLQRRIAQPHPSFDRLHRPLRALGLDEPCEARVRLHHVINYAVALVHAYCTLRWRPFERVIDGVRRRNIDARLLCVAMDRQKAAQLVIVLSKLRRLTYVMRNTCLLDTLVLLEFFARYQVFPNWVIGVTTAPFAAHSWAQYEEFILGTTPEATCFSYTPIMIV